MEKLLQHGGTITPALPSKVEKPVKCPERRVDLESPVRAEPVDPKSAGRTGDSDFGVTLVALAFAPTPASTFDQIVPAQRLAQSASCARRLNHIANDQPMTPQPPSQMRKAAASPVSAHIRPGRPVAKASSCRFRLVWPPARLPVARLRLGSPMHRAHRANVDRPVAIKASNIVMRLQPGEPQAAAALSSNPPPARSSIPLPTGTPGPGRR